MVASSSGETKLKRGVCRNLLYTLQLLPTEDKKSSYPDLIIKKETIFFIPKR